VTDLTTDTQTRRHADTQTRRPKKSVDTSAPLIQGISATRLFLSMGWVNISASYLLWGEVLPPPSLVSDEQGRG